MSSKVLPFYFSLSCDAVQVIAGAFEKERFKVESFSTVSLPVDVVKEGEIVQPRLLAQTLVQSLAQAKPRRIKTSFVEVGLSDQFVFSKFLSLPPIKEEELQGTIYFKIKDFLPFRPSEMYIDWQILESNSEKLEVNVMAVKRMIIDSYLQAFRLIDVFPIRFEPEACSLARLASLSGEKPSLIIYCSQTSVIFCFQEKGVVLFSSGFNYQSPQGESSELWNELNKAIFYWRENFAAKKQLEKIFLSGEVKEESILKSTIENSLQTRIEKLPLPITIPPQIPENRLTKMVPLFGLGLSGREADGKKTSLIPEKVKKQRDVFKFRKQTKNLMKITALLLSLFLSFYLFVFLSIHFRLVKVESSLSGMEKIRFSEEQEAIEKKAIYLNKKIVSLDKLLKREEAFATELDGLLTLIPAGIKVTSLDYNSAKKTIELRGEAANRSSVLSLEKSLAELGEVAVPLSSFQESENLEFTAVVKLNKK
jgi:Tfp pilus assembly PilM family ATPase